MPIRDASQPAKSRTSWLLCRVSKDDLACPDCRHELKGIGSFCAKQELLYVPAKVKRIDHIQNSYKCQHCSDEELTDKIIKATLTNSLGSASLISNTIYQKYMLKFSAYWQEKDLRRLGLPVDHKTVSNWHIKVCKYYLSSLYELLRQELLKLDVIHADETPYRVLDSERAKDYVVRQACNEVVVWNLDQISITAVS